MRYNPQTSIFAGMSTTVLRAQLLIAQQAYVDLAGGAKVVTATYTQGDGSKSVTYPAASLPNLTALIQQLQAQLGLVIAPRRSPRIVFR